MTGSQLITWALSFWEKPEYTRAIPGTMRKTRKLEVIIQARSAA